ncbi:LytTR family DNA-binding domain-containing protein [Algoriphagus sp.]|jgi:two-component system LytT family response regulator|uniref:LytR/AlgR family response regulator transcription factor n=1 Tax=Algoriphagus sp. TaxID=1872435 RepID=UPI00271C66F6|nr:LytTR family DNA-binding domain-containing protein [Algoriphagus sp.]MDO8966933.1 LytTR family DNA-binding domain-containing protein [Algoriphagus sp.]MDP3199743.1 LytTR family DNA-binding domain-containing protein [Algoriphagus sp.]
MAYRVLIVEDDAHARENLIRLIQGVSDLDLVGMATMIGEADQLCKSLKPDLVFCDVMLPPDTSFDWLMKLEKIPFELIFITSFEEFAVKAFRLAAVDYLIKPIAQEEFNLALERFRSRREKSTDQIQSLLKNLSLPREHAKIALPTLNGYLFVQIKDILRCESDNTYTTFFTADKRKILVSRTLKDVEQMLEEYRFFRVHNSHLINLDYVAEYFKGEGGQVKLTDGAVIDVSRRRKEEFLNLLRKGQ